MSEEEAAVGPETKCDRKRCGHELKWHNPCSRRGCRCHAFLAPMTEEERAAAGILDEEPAAPAEEAQP